MRINLSIILLLFLAFATYAQQPERERAIELYRAGDAVAALPIFQSIVNNDNRDRPAWMYLGMCLAKTGKSADAVKALRTANGIKYSKNDGEQYVEKLDHTIKITKRSPFAPGREARVGRVVLAVEFNADGKISLIVPVTSTSDAATRAAVDATQNIKFEPAVKNGKPVTVIRTMEFESSTF